MYPYYVEIPVIRIPLIRRLLYLQKSRMITLCVYKDQSGLFTTRLRGSHLTATSSTTDPALRKPSMGTELEASMEVDKRYVIRAV